MTSVHCCVRQSIKHTFAVRNCGQLQHLRCKSTTSAIKAGLQAESPGRSRYGRRDAAKDRFKTDWDDRDLKRYPRSSDRSSSFQRDDRSERGDYSFARSPRTASVSKDAAADQKSRFAARSERISSRRSSFRADEGELGFGGKSTVLDDEPSPRRMGTGRAAAKKIFRNRRVDPDVAEDVASSQSFRQRKSGVEDESPARQQRSESDDKPRTPRYTQDQRRDSGETSRYSREQRRDFDEKPRFARRELSDAGARPRFSRQRDDDGGRREPRRAPRSSRDDSENIPSAIPYTTASSQFLYGSNVVIAALTASRRRLYRLHMHKRSEAPNIAQIRRAATALDIDINRTADTGLLDRMSEGRPHNGVILEASAIPARPVQHFDRVRSNSRDFSLQLDEQSEEDQVVNGIEKTISKPSDRHAFVLFLDGVTDPGNLGNIIRSAHFFGVDAIVVATNTCAPLSSAVVAKASAGACEAVTILTTSKPAAFLHGSRSNGWTLCAAVAPADHDNDPHQDKRTLVTARDLSRKSLLTNQHCILMLGAEGEGLRPIYKKVAQIYVTIPRGVEINREADVGVDSLNVATAGAVLMSAFAS